MRWLFGVLVLFSMAAFFLPMEGGPSVIPDKFVHFAIFGALAGTGRLAGFRIVPLATGLLAYAVVSEIVQGALPFGRTADWQDSVADSIGVAAGLLGALVVRAVSDRIAACRAVRSGGARTPEHQR